MILFTVRGKHDKYMSQKFLKGGFMYNITEEKIEFTRTQRERVTAIIANVACGVMFCICLSMLVLSVVIVINVMPTPETHILLKFLWVFLQFIAYLVFGTGALVFLYEIVINIFDSPHPLIIDNDGIHVKFLFFKQHIRFEDIKDYGMSYVGKKYDFLSGFGGNRYHYSRNRIVSGRIYKVYFSTQECDTDINKGKKKLRGVKAWWLDVCPLTVYPVSPDGPLFLEEVFNFCEAKTGIKAFVPGNALPFVYREPKNDDK